MNPNLILIFAVAILYLALGIDFIRERRNHWTKFRSLTDKYILLYGLSLIGWGAIFIGLITWYAIEPLTKSRRNDWPENKTPGTPIHPDNDKDLPDFLKRQSD